MQACRKDTLSLLVQALVTGDPGARQRVCHNPSQKRQALGAVLL